MTVLTINAREGFDNSRTELYKFDIQLTKDVELFYTCPCCNGNKRVVSVNVNNSRETLNLICPHCNGEGRIKTNITIHADVDESLTYEKVFEDEMIYTYPEGISQEDTVNVSSVAFSEFEQRWVNNNGGE